MNIGPGDEVITVANSWISSSETISQTEQGQFLLILKEIHSIDASKIEEKITSKTKATVVHLHGQSCDLDPIISILKNNIKLIEDCAQSHLTNKNKM